jgi:hypothetical protein
MKQRKPDGNPVLAALGAAIIGATATAAIIHEHVAHAADARGQFAALVSAVNREVGDTLTVLTPAATRVYGGRVDVLSTSLQRVDFGADESFSDPPIPRADNGHGAYSVTVNAGPDSYAADGCALVRLDMLAGAAHVYMRCPAD